ncbi:AlkZ-related protein [Paenibacillus sp. S-38]|uniref:AlkZ-related protein n=1 Tax=Paenibacillus sp. S-38 TaxID=3416710 RepID=UPI003CFADBA2
MIQIKISTYKEAVQLINEVGILPLAPLIPNHPSLYEITFGEQWLTGTETDPWLWRTRLPSDGAAAYGKFIKKKLVLISRELVRYQQGLISKDALVLYRQIREEEGIETRSLRLKAGMHGKEMKKTFERSLLDLQETMDIVISGAKESRIILDVNSAWKSTTFESTDHWMENVGILQSDIRVELAKKELKHCLTGKCTVEALGFLNKLFQLDS